MARVTPLPQRGRTFRELEWRSPGLVCPDCGTCTIGVLLRCDLSDRECLPVASCSACGKQFDAGSLPTYEERLEDVRRDVEEGLCVVCGAGELEIRELCDRHARKCFFLVSCRKCGNVQLA